MCQASFRSVSSTSISLRTHARFTAQILVKISPTEPILTMYRHQKKLLLSCSVPIIRFRFEQIPYFPLDNCILSS